MTPAQQAALRQRRARQRRLNGRAVLHIETDMLAVPDWLIQKGFLKAWDADDRTKVAAALEQALDAWSRYA